MTIYVFDFYHEDGTFSDFASEGICTNQKIYKHQKVCTKNDEKCQKEKKTS